MYHTQANQPTGYLQAFVRGKLVSVKIYTEPKKDSVGVFWDEHDLERLAKTVLGKEARSPKYTPIVSRVL
jgi:hypothetical protein